MPLANYQVEFDLLSVPRQKGECTDLQLICLFITFCPCCCPLVPRSTPPRERSQQLQLLSQDTDRLDAWVVEFMPNANKLSQVLADGGGNLTVLLYDKTVRGTIIT